MLINAVNEALSRMLEAICVYLQLTKAMVQNIHTSYGAVTSWLDADGSSLQQYDPDLYAQGSVRIDTTNRPVVGNDYDADIVCELYLRMQPFPSPGAVFNLLWNRIGDHEKYRTTREAKKRCVRLAYDGYHLDVLPAIRDPERGGTALLVPDRELRIWKNSDPKGYADWFRLCGVMSEPQTLIRGDIEPMQRPKPVSQKTILNLAVQLLKRARDVAFQGAEKVQPVSVVLTTLAGHAYGGERDVYDALLTIVRRMVAGIPAQGVLQVFNPVNPAELLSERWQSDRAAYAAYVAWIRHFCNQLEALQNVRMPKLAEELKKIFGDNAVHAAVKDVMSTIEKARGNGELQMQPSTGSLLIASSPVAAIPVRRNTFYGD